MMDSHYKFILNLNLPSDLNEKYTAKFHICENSNNIKTFWFNDFSLANEIITRFKLLKYTFACLQILFLHEKLYLSFPVIHKVGNVGIFVLL